MGNRLFIRFRIQYHQVQHLFLIFPDGINHSPRIRMDERLSVNVVNISFALMLPILFLYRFLRNGWKRMIGRKLKLQFYFSGFYVICVQSGKVISLTRSTSSLSSTGVSSGNPLDSRYASSMVSDGKKKGGHFVRSFLRFPLSECCPPQVHPCR